MLLLLILLFLLLSLLLQLLPPPRPTQHLVKLVYVVCSDSDGSFQRPPKEETEDLASLTDSRSLRLAQSTFGSVEEGVRKLRVAGQVNIKMMTTMN